jgi:hypothetical protein
MVPFFALFFLWKSGGRCPSCQKLLEIEVRTKIEITIKPAERYISEKKPKFGKLPIAFLFPFPASQCFVCICLVMKCADCVMECITGFC